MARRGWALDSLAPQLGGPGEAALLEATDLLRGVAVGFAELRQRDGLRA